LKLEFEESDGIGIEGLIPNAPKELIDLIEKMLMIDPEIRLSIDEAMNHPFFFSLTELKKYQNKVISKIVENK
jgi:serine/threonine protein kinase